MRSTGRHEGDAGVPARREDGPHLELAVRVVARVLGRAHEVVRRAGAEPDRRLEGARQHLDAEAEAEVLDGLVREGQGRRGRRRPVERDERVALGRGCPDHRGC